MEEEVRGFADTHGHAVLAPGASVAVSLRAVGDFFPEAFGWETGEVGGLVGHVVHEGVD